MASFSSSVFSADASGVEDDINRKDVVVVVVVGFDAVALPTNVDETGQMNCFARAFRAPIDVPRKAVRRAADPPTTRAANFLLKDMTGVGLCNTVARRIATTRVQLHFVVNGKSLAIECE